MDAEGRGRPSNKQLRTLRNYDQTKLLPLQTKVAAVDQQLRMLSNRIDKIDRKMSQILILFKHIINLRARRTKKVTLEQILIWMEGLAQEQIIQAKNNKQKEQEIDDTDLILSLTNQNEQQK